MLIRPVIKDIMKRFGFKTLRNYHFKEFGKLTCAVYVQKSQFSDTYMINVGVVHADDPQAKVTNSAYWNVDNSLDNLISEYPKRLFAPGQEPANSERRQLLAALDQENDMDDATRIKIFEKHLTWMNQVFENDWSVPEKLYSLARQTEYPGVGINLRFKKIVADYDAAQLAAAAANNVVKE